MTGTGLLGGQPGCWLVLSLSVLNPLFTPPELCKVFPSLSSNLELDISISPKKKLQRNHAKTRQSSRNLHAWIFRSSPPDSPRSQHRPCFHDSFAFPTSRATRTTSCRLTRASRCLFGSKLRPTTTFQGDGFRSSYRLATRIRPAPTVDRGLCSSVVMSRKVFTYFTFLVIQYS